MNLIIYFFEIRRDESKTQIVYFFEQKSSNESVILRESRIQISERDSKKARD